jgi:hypothetical protein
MEPICLRLVTLIERNADRLSRSWLADVRRRDETPTYHGYSEEVLYQRAFRVYSQLGRWICQDTTKEMIADHYIRLGRQRYREGFALSEVIEALILTRRHLWLLVLSEGFLNTAFDLHGALDLNARVVLFFDRAMYFTALGFEAAAADEAT